MPWKTIFYHSFPICFQLNGPANGYSNYDALKLTISYSYKPSKQENSKPKICIQSTQIKKTEINQ